MGVNSRQNKIKKHNEEVFKIYDVWVDALDIKGLREECKCLFKELPKDNRNYIVKEILTIAELQQLQLETGVEIINVKEDGTHEHLKK